MEALGVTFKRGGREVVPPITQVSSYQLSGCLVKERKVKGGKKMRPREPKWVGNKKDWGTEKNVGVRTQFTWGRP